jgi:hypothetical protein
MRKERTMKTAIALPMSINKNIYNKILLDYCKVEIAA